MDREAWWATSSWGRKELDTTERLILSQLEMPLESSVLTATANTFSPFAGRSCWSDWTWAPSVSFKFPRDDT